jgi:hypothetical protein
VVTQLASANFFRLFTQGTTSFKLSEVLRNNGIKTGLFVSPHLASYRERIQVDAELLPEESFVRNLQTLTSLCAQHDIPATEFELTFLMAALHFQQTQCEAVVLEVRADPLWRFAAAHARLLFFTDSVLYCTYTV